MKIGNLVLAASASLSLLAGAILQDDQVTRPLSPKELFAQAKDGDYIGGAACADCHGSKATEFHKSGHAIYVSDPSSPKSKQGCEACHGPGAFHIREENSQVIKYQDVPPERVSEACLRCHESIMKKSHWEITAHARSKVSCVSCHQIHPKDEDPSPEAKNKGLLKKKIFPAVKATGSLLKNDEAPLCGECHKSEVAKFRQNSHHPVPEGRMVCSDCHEIHPTHEKKPTSATVKQKCVTCHADVAGPFVYEHDPVAGWTGGGCEECHNAHGSHNPNLLKGFSRGLCSQCHTDKSATHYPGQTCWSAGCHVAVHGSNSDKRFLHR